MRDRVDQCNQLRPVVVAPRVQGGPDSLRCRSNLGPYGSLFGTTIESRNDADQPAHLASGAVPDAATVLGEPEARVNPRCDIDGRHPSA